MQPFIGPEEAWCYTTSLFSQSITSASVFVYTQDGFIIGSDGRSARGSTRETVEIESDYHVKIFPAHAKGIHAAYVINGFVGSGGCDLIAEAARQAEKLSTRRFDDCREYVRVFSRALQRYIGESKRDRLFAKFPENVHRAAQDHNLIASLFVLGYSNGHPYWVNAHFRHRNQTSVFTDLETPPFSHGYAVSYGSEIITTLINRGADPGLLAHRDRISRFDPRVATLETAVDFADAVIASQSSDLAHELDPDSISIGGHTHIAAVTADGFRWMIPPRSEEEIA